MTKKLLLVGLAVGLLVLLLSSVSRAATPPAETLTTTSLPAAFTIQATPLRSSSCAHGWTITLDKPITNTLGRVQVWPALDAYWCGGAQMQKVTNLVDLSCYSKGGFYSYDGCHKSHGKLGFSYLSVHADWHYHWIINGLTFDKTPALNVQFYPDGRAVGTWYWFTA